ncbi:hypothetical protein [Conchiformibius steedae]|uniref:Uncharacterized protein n=1 Tax=Conchiformibius steedae TaxID=153493 RepID=A0A3P2A7S5_9NEIS|nr:hypothetical protein [Conchiformibius steedae]RRD91035.1 hypothetical protein EII21_03560 [Conchiformibius steedae]
MSIQKRLPFLIAAAFGSAHGFANGNSCSVHDHLCAYHAVGRPITSYKGIDNDETRLVIYGRVLNTPDGKPVDFDNHVMLPTHNTETNESTGRFVVSRTAYGGRNPSEVKVEDWERTSDNPATEGAHIYPSQYQVIFNKNTAKARHSGDFNGGENGNIPNAVGCPGHTGNPKDCEAVIITGNVPSGVYSQKLHMFNHHKQENPEANIRMGAWATGQGVLVVKHHDPNFAMASVSEEQEVHGADVNLVGNKAQSQQVDYHFHNNGFDPHAAGTAAWHYGFTHQRIKDGTYTQYNQHTNTIDTMQKVKNVYGHLTTTVQADGTASTRHHQRETVGEYVAGRKPVPKVAPTSSQDSGAKSGWGSLGSFFQPFGEFGNSLIKSVENNSMVQSTKKFVQQKLSDVGYHLSPWERKDILGTPIRCDKRNKNNCQVGFIVPEKYKDDPNSTIVFGVEALDKHWDYLTNYGAGNELIEHFKKDPLYSNYQQGLSNMKPCPSTPPKSNNNNWKSYVGNDKIYHCGNGTTGNVTILEKTNVQLSDNRLMNECVYINGVLVDHKHKYAGCVGTPDRFYTADNLFKHSTIDVGGPLFRGERAYKESRRYMDEQGVKTDGLTTVKVLGLDIYYGTKDFVLNGYYDTKGRVDFMKNMVDFTIKSNIVPIIHDQNLK